MPIGGGKRDSKPSPAHQPKNHPKEKQIQNKYWNKFLLILNTAFNFNYEFFNVSKIIQYTINKLICFYKSQVLTHLFLNSEKTFDVNNKCAGNFVNVITYKDLSKHLTKKEKQQSYVMNNRRKQTTGYSSEFCDKQKTVFDQPLVNILLIVFLCTHL